MDAINTASMLILYALLIAAVCSDLRSGTVSNRLILSGLVLAFLLRCAEDGIGAILGFIPNIFFPVILLFLFFICGALGAGDIKLFSMIGGFVEMNRLIRCIGLSFLVAALWSFVLLLCRRRLWVSIRRVGEYAGALLRGQILPYEPADRRNTIPFTLAILIGTLLSAL